jgi:DNA-binding NarL/FixJ family response regulator
VIRVLLADDQDLVREGLRMMLDAQADIEVVGEAASGKEVLGQIRDCDPDVVVMDIQMPEMDGIETTQRLVSAGSRAAVLVLTTFDLDEYVYRALAAGASGFLLKDGTSEQLATAVRTVAAGQAMLAPVITRRLIADYCRPRPPEAGGAPTVLSDRELDVVRELAQGRSNAEIAQRMFLSEATVKSHIARILTKLGLRDRVQIVIYAYEHGLVGGTTQAGQA